MIVTGVERALNIKKTDKLAEEKGINELELDKYVRELAATKGVGEVKKREERRDEEREDRGKQQGEVKSGAKKKMAAQTAFSWVKERKLPRSKIVLQAAKEDNFRKLIGAHDLKEYFISHIKATVGIPKEEIARNRETTEALRTKFIHAGEEAFRQKVERELSVVISDELSRLIKAYVLSKISDDKKLAEFVMSNKKLSRLLSFTLVNEITGGLDKYSPRGILGRTLSRTLKDDLDMRPSNIDEMASLAEELGIDLLSWIKAFINDKLYFGSDGTIIIDKKIMDDQREKALLLDEYKTVHVSLLLGRGLIESFFLNRRSGKIESALYALGSNRREISEAYSQAKNIAWANIIFHLREAHLARIFSGTEDEFETYSVRISGLTNKARSIGRGISEEGQKLVESKIELLALDAANYKIELLKSMQTFEYDGQRERDIKWLKTTMERHKEKESRVELWEKVANFIASFV